jgi:lysophospholipase L1-like esterase
LARLARVLAGILVSCLLLLAGVEAALQVAARFAPDRASSWRPGTQVHVLCVGDSHTFGAGVPARESYPAQLQVMLDERWPGRFSIVNLGVPGMSTAQVRERLPLELARYEPDLVILWAGINNIWSASRSSGSAGLLERLEALALRSRLYRLVRVALHDLSLERAAAATRADGRPQEAVAENCRGEGCDFKATWRLRHAGVEEVVVNRETAERDPQAQTTATARDIRAMAEALRAAGVGFALVRYPLDIEPFDRANRGILEAAHELDLPVADSTRALERVPEEQRRWVWALHPTGPIYHEIARELVPIVEALAPPGNSTAR